MNRSKTSMEVSLEMVAFLNESNIEDVDGDDDSMRTMRDDDDDDG